MRHYSRLLCGAAAIAILTSAGAARAEGKAQVQFDIPAQPLTAALNQFGIQSGSAILFKADVTGAKVSRPLAGAADPEMALAMMLDGTGLSYRREGQAFVIVSASDPQSASAAGDGADAGTVQALIVTAQKREENIQDVPIAMSAFTQEDLTRSQVAGGPDLMTQVPNMTFTKTNFSSYSIQIRGIGTQAISATTDPGVAVAFNNTPFVRNRFFEQEFYDLERVEVLRGPQGTLYGRNATAGVVNIISAKPTFHYEAKLSADVGNYSSTRLEGMVNVPLVDDKVALRIAGAWTKRDGFDTNQITGNPIDGRDLRSTRVSLRIAPTDRINANLIWEHFQEDDDRLRSGKQLCKTDEVTNFKAVFPDGTVQNFQTGHYDKLYDYGQSGSLFTGVQATFSQGCEASSLYSPDSFQTPNGLSVPYYIAIQAIGFPGFQVDPYVSRFQSQDLRTIESTVDPHYRAKSDLAELQLSFDIMPDLTLSSESAYGADFVFSTEDFNRFNTAPGAFREDGGQRPGSLVNGVYCDPQIGCADRLVAVDLSTARSRQFSQEFRLASNFEGPFNFSLGANFLRYDTEDKYYVFINSLGLLAAQATLEGYSQGIGDFINYVGGQTDNRDCLDNGPIPPNPAFIQGVQGCIYIDPNPIDNLNDQGHNYFLSRNPYKLISYAAFGEAYYQIADNLKLTAGLRWTVDKKQAPIRPSWVLATQSVGYPITEVVNQEWREPTGRLTIDWKPDLSFTDQTLLYASLAHGYKAGGANPPAAGPVTYAAGGDLATAIINKSATHPKTFEPEFVNALEVGAKNTLLDGRLTLNAAAFYYDYTGYQISQIIDRSATNFNFDARIWGLEIEADWLPLENLRLGFKGGYENTRVADGMKAVDIMDRTAGHEGWVVVRPFPTMTANCILPAWLFVSSATVQTPLVNLGGPSGGNPAGCELAYMLHLDPITEQPYVLDPSPDAGRAYLHYPNYPGWDPSTAPNNGEGFDKDLSGNELPNAPHFTATVTADYTVPLPSDWLMTLHTDLYYQSEAWTRIFNTPGYDKLKAYTNVNLAAIFTNEDAGWKVMAYVKNVFDRDSITGAFLNSDDTGLTTNVFLTEPRLYGLRVTKDWTGGAWWSNRDHPTGEPYPFTIELGGSALRADAPYDPVKPEFTDTLSSTLRPSITSPQNRDLDWGDGREVKLTYSPGPWRISAAYRVAESNGGSHKALATEIGDTGCRFFAPCSGVFQVVTGTNYVDADVRDHEKHTIIDFMVGREVGIGALGMESTLSAGIRHAEFESATRFIGFAIPDWDVADNHAATYYYGLPSTHHRYETDITAQREFKGAGPVLSWEAAKQLLGDDASGHLDVDWSLEGGVLFGKQKTFGSGAEHQQYFNANFYYEWATMQQSGPTVVTPPATPSRSKSVAAPTFATSLGLSYEVQRLKVSTGYRWERYFDVLDAGWASSKKVDRTIDGPYFKVSVGFGG